MQRECNTLPKNPIFKNKKIKKINKKKKKKKKKCLSCSLHVGQNYEFSTPFLLKCVSPSTETFLGMLLLGTHFLGGKILEKIILLLFFFNF